MKTVLALSTYFRENCSPERIDIFGECLRSLAASGFGGEIIIVDDGSKGRFPMHKVIQAFAQSKVQPQIFFRDSRGGIAKCKNTCLRLALEAGADLIFLADDDVYFGEGWDLAYEHFMSRSGFPHVSAIENHTAPVHGQTITHLGIEVFRQSMHSGYFTAWKRHAIDKVGFYAKFPKAYGFEHVNLSRRAVHAGLIPFVPDMPGSWRYVRPFGASASFPSLSEVEVQEGTRDNLKILGDMAYVELHE